MFRLLYLPGKQPQTSAESEAILASDTNLNFEDAENRTTNIQSSNPPTIHQGCTNPVHQVSMTTKFCTMAPSRYGPSVRHLLHVIHLASRILRYLLHFQTISHPCYPLYQLIFPVSAAAAPAAGKAAGAAQQLQYTYFQLRKIKDRVGKPECMRSYCVQVCLNSVTSHGVVVKDSCSGTLRLVHSCVISPHVR